MGHMVEGVLSRRGHELVLASEDICSVDPEVARECVCIDFTAPDAFRANYPYIAQHFKAAVIGTTGWDDIREEVVGAFEAARTPMIFSSNFSIGVNAVFSALEKVSGILRGNGYDSHITETHHIHKLDAPSGTAKSMAGIVSRGRGTVPEIESIREGEVPGTHTVEFRSGFDRIEITHEAFSRAGFAEGAVVAAEMTVGLSGVHTFGELILNQP